MSGGSYDYAYHNVENMAGQIKHSKDPIRRAFAKHLELVAKAMHDIEWVDSGDCSIGYEHKAINAVLGINLVPMVMQECIDDAKLAIRNLEVIIEKANEVKK